ncbi:hypothetical protein [Streptomyces sp. NPDC058735]|uniref:hypothetical protein n=1 Tax=unclassified Streptomyces TaxID=2593676 RepID=UPI0036B2CE21
MRTGKGDILGWLGRLLPTVALLVCLSLWPSLAPVGWAPVLVGVVRAVRRPRGGGSLLRWCAGVCVDVTLSSVLPYGRPVRLRGRTLRRAATVCAALCAPTVRRPR